MIRKILLVFIMLTISIKAQYNVLQNFEGLQSYDGVIVFGNGNASILAACSGFTSWSQSYSANESSGGLAIDFSALPVKQKSNGQKITVSVKYKKTANLSGSLYLTLNTFDPVKELWSISVISSKNITSSAVSKCTSFSEELPVGKVLEDNLASGSKYSIGAFFQRSTGSGTIYFDDLSIIQEVVSTVPGCATFVSPANESVINYGQTHISWPAVSGATKYQLKIGASSNASGVLNMIVPATNLSMDVILKKRTTYFAKVIPMNSIGDAINCNEISFSTNSDINYCGPVGITNVEPITYVNFAGIDHVSAAETGGTAHEFFTESKGIVETAKTYKIDLNGNTDGDFTSQYVVFIDWNQNGSLNDPGEVYFADGTLMQTDSDGVTSIPVYGDIVVPEGAKSGSTRIRIKKAYYDGEVSDNNPCNLTTDYGQFEDYSLTIKEPVLKTDNVTKDLISLYPNPFQDVLKISDLKGVKNISIKEVSGRILKNMKPSAELNFAHLKAGLYIITLYMKDGTMQSRKVIKK
ncbi:T9SS type A sorting domain-containing protein [Chryseobacterium sp. SNU WT5]|uniref:T9SS type A sorting domain-containing protein n=1 Tax=Chryseobacterium sp. SNU WT5 TaxID=2594269 RepID=UPI00117C2387|nr:T9SS type A sorting domain-containing protein [Chryseobacterium sp. SNU WT5]QDP84520.1 T9SS type A sorting domain-containing protein [Chryseobacterium sp. SNU WT5]